MNGYTDKDVFVLHLYVDLKRGVDGNTYKNSLNKFQHKIDGYPLIETVMRDYVFDYYRFEFKGVFRQMDDIDTFINKAITDQIQLLNKPKQIANVIGDDGVTLFSALENDGVIEIEKRYV